MREHRKFDGYVDREEPKEPIDVVQSVFLFVGFGWRLSDAFLFSFSIEKEMDPDEAYREACEKFAIRYPRCSAAVFFKHDVKNDKESPVLYEYYELPSKGDKDE